MTREEIINGLKSIAASEGLYDDKKPSKKALTLGETIKMLSTEICEDAVSRQAALKMFKAHSYLVQYDSTSIEAGMTITGIKQVLSELPPVTPAPKRQNG